MLTLFFLGFKIDVWGSENKWYHFNTGRYRLNTGSDRRNIFKYSWIKKITILSSIAIRIVVHGCPERQSILSRFWKSNLGLIMVNTWKSIKIYVGIWKKSTLSRGRKSEKGKNIVKMFASEDHSDVFTWTNVHVQFLKNIEVSICPQNHCEKLHFWG